MVHNIYIYILCVRTQIPNTFFWQSNARHGGHGGRIHGGNEDRLLCRGGADHLQYGTTPNEASGRIGAWCSSGCLVNVN